MSRDRLPPTRQALTHKLVACGCDLYVTIGFYDGTAKPGELFVTVNGEKIDPTIAGFINAVATTVSIAWQYDVPWSALRAKYMHHRFEPQDDVNPSLLHAITVGVDCVLDARQKSLNQG